MSRTIGVVAGVLVLVAGGCGRASPSSRIDVPALERELAGVIHQRFLAEGYDYEPRVACDPAGPPLTYHCAVHVPHHRRVHWNEVVVCSTLARARGGQRCSSSSGEALQ